VDDFLSVRNMAGVEALAARLEALPVGGRAHRPRSRVKVIPWN
jgi:hypothetical protein